MSVTIAERYYTDVLKNNYLYANVTLLFFMIFEKSGEKPQVK